MLVWFAHMVQIILVGFVGFCIVLAVDNKLIAKMIVVVACIIALQVTIEDVTPTIHKLQAEVNSIQQSVDKVTKFIP